MFTEFQVYIYIRKRNNFGSYAEYYVIAGTRHLSPTYESKTAFLTSLLFSVLVIVSYASAVQAGAAGTATDTLWCGTGRCFGRLFQ